MRMGRLSGNHVKAGGVGTMRSRRNYASMFKGMKHPGWLHGSISDTRKGHSKRAKRIPTKSKDTRGVSWLITGEKARLLKSLHTKAAVLHAWYLKKNARLCK